MNGVEGGSREDAPFTPPAYISQLFSPPSLIVVVVVVVALVVAAAAVLRVVPLSTYNATHPLNISPYNQHYRLI